ncbi:hypothetical protein FB45DRAFT_1004650 [Roridomyces roridus]|uniref:Uncharacterized protein n=1 Tax=Roridomyces roridus TaxID=1738132 RepID=A0AAD7BPW9_9AGAR|nr:hypothetical protein FB45DRAFT_1004650 [Roridomyces roridus]
MPDGGGDQEALTLTLTLLLPLFSARAAALPPPSLRASRTSKQTRTDDRVTTSPRHRSVLVSDVDTPIPGSPYGFRCRYLGPFARTLLVPRKDEAEMQYAADANIESNNRICLAASHLYLLLWAIASAWQSESGGVETGREGSGPRCCGSKECGF